MRWKFVDLGDRRLNQRVVNILERLGLALGRSIPRTKTEKFNFFLTQSETVASGAPYREITDF